MTGGRLAETDRKRQETTMFRHALIAATAATVAIMPTAAHADRFENQVRAQMLGRLAVAASGGFSLTDPVQFGQLRQGQTMTYTLTLDRNREYIVAASCDTDCRDLDISLSEPNGIESIADRGADDQPSFVVRGHGGTHTIRVTMAHCAVGPCRFGVGIFGK
jgi:hypothetical protein